MSQQHLNMKLLQQRLDELKEELLQKSKKQNLKPMTKERRENG